MGKNNPYVLGKRSKTTEELAVRDPYDFSPLFSTAVSEMREDILILNASKSLSKIHPALRTPATEKCHQIRSVSPASLIHTKTCAISRSFCLIDTLVQKMLVSITSIQGTEICFERYTHKKNHTQNKYIYATA